PPQIGGKSISVAITKRKGGDFWTPSKAPEKAKGNLIDIPTNNNIAAVPGAHVTPVIPGPQTHSSSKSQTGSSKNQVNNFKSQATNSKIQTSSSKIQTSSSKIQTSSSKSQTNNTKSSGHNSHNTQSKHSAANPTKKRPPGSAEGQRATLSFPRIAKEELTLQPGEIRGIACNPRLFQTSMKTWCETAFISYETLHNLSSDSNQGTVCTSTLTWGSQLDISTFRMHYGSSFTPSGSGRQYPVLSSLTVEMRQYGDKDSAAGVLAIRNNGQLPDSCDGSLTEGINVTTRAPILSMKCLESGHLVASSGTGNGDYTLQVWDMRDQREKAEIPVAILTRKKPRSKFWFDVQRMDVCSVDTRGVINAFDLYNAVSSGQHTTTANVDCTTMTDIDQEYSFFSSCISVNGFDSTVLVGSDEHAQIARWDPRSPSDAFTSMACRRTESSSIQRKNFDPVYDIAWNPSNINEFMTVHLNTIRVWDARKMDHDACATLHQFPIPRTTWFRKARWSPHHSDCIASLTVDGLVKIWKINKFDNHAEITAGVQKPEPLFIHQAHELIVSDFSWCPYNEDVIATVAPGMLNTAGNIQVWRPRNLHDSDDFEEP
ncbi:Histone-binding protein rbbp4, partial [Mortierella sp. AM989]